MNPFIMIMVAVAIAIEKLLPHPGITVRLIGGAAIVTGMISVINWMAIYYS